MSRNIQLGWNSLVLVESILREAYLDCKLVYVVDDVCTETENYDPKWHSISLITSDSVNNKLWEIRRLQQAIRIWIAHFTWN